MPSALEKLVKILRLEQETGYKNTAVIGGLQSYMPNWTNEAHQQAKTSKHHSLVEELAKVLTHYGTLDDRTERRDIIKYMLGRITGRIPPRSEFAVESDESDDDDDETPDETDAQSPDDDITSPTPASPGIIERTFEMLPAYGQPPLITESPMLPRPERRPAKKTSSQQQEKNREKLNTSITTLHGVGKKRAELLANLNIYTIRDLLFHLPRRYEDYSKTVPINRLPLGETITISGTIRSIDERYARNKRSYLTAVLDDGSGQIRVTFFNQPYLKQTLKPGMQVAFYGKTELYLGQITMTNPEWEAIDQVGLERGYIIPIYPLTEGISNKMMRNMVKQALDEWYGKIPDYIPEHVLDRTGIMDINWAIRQVHLPKNQSYIAYAQERLAFEELMLLQLGILAKRREWRSVEGVPLSIPDDWMEALLDYLPYQLTDAQQKALNDIRHDIAAAVPMNRLLQGDVGSGKTIVATLALAMALVNGTQAALMAPTAILAEQHYQKICQFFENHPDLSHFEIRLLTGGTGETERHEIYEGLASGTIHLVIGTHALIQENVNFNRLALAIIDEQHRFGVEERGSLRGKGYNPHVLVMTATPIPRTLALTMYADLDLTVLDEMPPGRKPVETRLIEETARERIYSFIQHQIQQGRQAYIVYPLVEASEHLQMPGAVEAFEDLRQTTFRDYRVGLLHGRMKATEKDDIMAQFYAGELDILIATTVIEVGIDVPNATIMLIEGSSRFGLAQLHQLRGRVGRGEHASYCLLMSDTTMPEALERLQAVASSADGFELARIDWELRGPGDLLGTRQAGYAYGGIQMSTLMNSHLVELAQTESRTIYEEDPYLEQPEHEFLQKHLNYLHDRQTDPS